MKKTILLHVMLLLAIAAFSQPKPKQKDMPPTQKEMADMMKEMQAQLDGMSAEDKKMMDSMGIKMPSMKDLPKFSDKQMAEALENEALIVPKRDAARIAAIPKAVTNVKMGAYIAAVQNQLTPIFKPAVVSTGNEVYNYIRSTSKNSGEAANMAMGFWLTGKPELALYLLGKICATDAGNTDNLSNYSAMLSMLGAQHLAIPILNNLNQRFPNNSTLLNNLGQAWFGLGEIGKAEKYLDSTIRICAYHPQANLTKSLIEESKGNKQQAIEAVKRSIKKAYSMEKENRIEKLGDKLKSGDISWNKPMPQDPLGLEKFKWPAYPMNVAESELLEPEWDVFRQTCQAEIDELDIRLKSLENTVEQTNAARTKQLIQAGQQGLMSDPLPRFAYKAIAKLHPLVDDKDGHIAFSYQKKWDAISSATTQAAGFEEILSEQLRVLDEKYKNKFGEGKENPFDAACADDTKAKNNYLNSSNVLLRDAFNDLLHFMRNKINNEVYYYQYTMWPENFELAKVQAKRNWLSLIKSQTPKFKDKSSWCQNKTEVQPKNFKLPNFDDINCQYKSSLNLGCVKMETNCASTTTTYGCVNISFTERELGQNYTGGTLKFSDKTGVSEDFGPLTVEAYIGGDYTIELDANNHVKDFQGKVTAAVEAGIGVTKGPVKAGASVKEALEIELDKTGISDVTIVSAAKIEAGIAAPKSPGDKKIDEQINKGVDYVNKGIGKLNTSVEMGVECRTSLMSGSVTVNGTGAYSGVKLAGW